MEDTMYDLFKAYQRRGFQEVFIDDIKCEGEFRKYLAGYPLPSDIVARCTFKWDEQEHVGLLYIQFNELSRKQAQWNLLENYAKKQVYLDRTKVDALRDALAEAKNIQEHWKEWFHVYTKEERKDFEDALDEDMIPF